MMMITNNKLFEPHNNIFVDQPYEFVAIFTKTCLRFFYAEGNYKCDEQAPSNSVSHTNYGKRCSSMACS
jgi:hypothetical protein